MGNTDKVSATELVASPNKMTSTSPAEKKNIVTSTVRPQLSNKRFVILLLFCLYSMSNAFQWIEYSIITNIISDYYGVSEMAVNWTSVIYMVIYVPGIIPASWLLNKKGLRFCVLIGSLGTALGAWVKCASVAPDRFWVTMIGQGIVATSQLFILNLPPRIAAVWFDTNEASRATSIGVFGNQIGIAIGFVLPPQLVTTTSPETIAQGLRYMFYGVAILCTLIFIAIVFMFDDTPKYPPSFAAMTAAETKEDSYTVVIKSLMTNRNYVLILITYGLNVGVFYAVSTVLNQMVTSRFEDSEKAAGYMGLILTVAGIFGSIICGYALDKTHMYKETTLSVYFFSFIGMLAFTGALRLHEYIWPLYFVSFALGFFMTGYLPIGFEFAAEVSYPNPEGTSAGLLNAAAQVISTEIKCLVMIKVLIIAFCISSYSDLRLHLDHLRF